MTNLQMTIECDENLLHSSFFYTLSLHTSILNHSWMSGKMIINYLSAPNSDTMSFLMLALEAGFIKSIKMSYVG